MALDVKKTKMMGRTDTGRQEGSRLSIASRGRNSKMRI